MGLTQPFLFARRLRQIKESGTSARGAQRSVNCVDHVAIVFQGKGCKYLNQKVLAKKTRSP